MNSFESDHYGYEGKIQNIIAVDKNEQFGGLVIQKKLIPKCQDSNQNIHFRMYLLRIRRILRIHIQDKNALYRM
jgi:hypothetical protein